MKRLKSMTIDQILKSYAFPHKFYVRYALDCAYTVKHLMMTDERSLKALEVTELWLQGKATQEEIKVAAADAAYASADATSYAASAAATSYAASAAAYAAAYATSYAAAYAYSSAYYADAAFYSASSRTILETTLKDMLLKQIETLSEFQRLMLGIEV